MTCTASRRQILSAALASALGLSGPALANTDSNLKLVITFPPGGSTDIAARILQPRLAEKAGRPVVVENRPGAASQIATQYVAKSAPDGNTVLVSFDTHAINPIAKPRLPYDTFKDFTGVSLALRFPLVIGASASVPAKDLKELVALLKANPGKYNYGSAGNGTILHLGAEQFKDATGTFSTHIPYRGTGPLVADLIGGQVDWAVVALPAIQGQIKAGLVRALAIASPQRSAAAPDIPTAAEAGVPGFQVEGWFAVIGPKGLSAEQVKRVNLAVVTAFNTPEVKEAMAKQGNTIQVTTPEAATAHFKRELAKYAALVKKAGVEPQ